VDSQSERRRRLVDVMATLAGQRKDYSLELTASCCLDGHYAGLPLVSWNADAIHKK